MFEDKVSCKAGPGDKVAAVDCSYEGRHHGAEQCCMEECSKGGFGGCGPDGTRDGGRVFGTGGRDRVRSRGRVNPGVGAANTSRNTGRDTFRG